MSSPVKGGRLNSLIDPASSHQALSDVVPLRDVFGLLFFVTVGMLFGPGFAVRHAAQIRMEISTPPI
jgi:predicted Kef-type K+ transport protein